MREIEIFRSAAAAAPVWRWEIPLYLFLGGLAAGVMIIAALLPRRIAAGRESRAMRLLPLAAPLILSAGMLALFLDLGAKLHVFRFFTAFRPSSPMSWGAWILVLIYPATLLYAVARNDFAFVPRAIAAFARKHERALQRANVALGIALGGYTGILLGTLAARALWSTLLLGPLFLLSGFSTGAALTLLLPISAEEHALVRRWDVAAIIGEAALLALVFIELAVDGGARGRAAAALFFGGPYTAPFFALVVIAGLAVPLLIEVLEERVAKAAALAPALLLIGGLALRWIFVAAGQAS